MASVAVALPLRWLSSSAIVGGGATWRKFEDLTCKDIFDCVKQGNRVALGLVEEMTQLLGKVIAAISRVCDPDIFVIGGVSKAGSTILDGVKKAFRQFAFPASEETAFTMAELGDNAGIYGGIRMILEG